MHLPETITSISYMFMKKYIDGNFVTKVISGKL